VRGLLVVRAEGVIAFGFRLISSPVENEAALSLPLGCPTFLRFPVAQRGEVRVSGAVGAGRLLNESSAEVLDPPVLKQNCARY
jgi:hypothetical protein